MKHSLYTLIFAVCILSFTSCAQRSIYETIWNAEEYFTDPQIVALCKAIEKEDIPEIDRLVAEGADVNARGKDGMTPLLWAYPAGENALEQILEHGADPNTQYFNEFGSRGMVEKGDSLLFVAIKSTRPSNEKNAEKFHNYIDILLKHGANPNQMQAVFEMPPLWNAIRFKNHEAAEKLIKAGADIDFKDDVGRSLISYAAGLNAHLVLRILIENGADYRVIDRSNGLTVTQIIGSHYDRFIDSESEAGKQYRETVAWMETRGMSIERAKEQWELWQNKPVINGDYEGSRKKYIKEVVEPEIARWLPPGVEAPVPPAVQPAPPVAPPVAQQAWNPLPVLALIVVLLLLAGGIWFWTWKRGKIAS